MQEDVRFISHMKSRGWRFGVQNGLMYRMVDGEHQAFHVHSATVYVWDWDKKEWVAQERRHDSWRDMLAAMENGSGGDNE